jgi:hypothetical protein
MTEETTDTSERKRRIRYQIRLWTERAEIARKQQQADVAEVAERLIMAYEDLMDQDEQPEPEVMARANNLRNRIEATEQHRTMAAEHGLGNEAIDSTYEIQALEKELVELIHNWRGQ